MTATESLDLVFVAEAVEPIRRDAHAQGIRFVTMQEVDSPEMRHRLYPLANQVSLDMPSLEPMHMRAGARPEWQGGRLHS